MRSVCACVYGYDYVCASRICCHMFVGLCVCFVVVVFFVLFFFKIKSLFHQLIVMIIVAMASMKMASRYD